MATPELAQQMSFEGLLKDLLYAQSQYAEWSDIVKVHKTAVDEKLQSTKDDARISRTTSVNEASGMQITQLSIDLGDYALNSAERVRRSFSEKTIVESITLKQRHIENELRRAQSATNADSVQGQTAVAMAQAKLQLIHEILQDLQGAVSYTRYRVVEPKLQTKL